MTALALDIQGLTKTYASKSGEAKHALQGINLQVPKGAFFGLLGPNGAGKSTLINILAGIVVKSSGSAKICGHCIETDTRAAKSSIGVVPQELFLDPFFPVFEALENTAGYYGIPKSKRRTQEIIDAVGLSDKAFVAARKLSGGMRRRLLVAKALVHSPEVLILDEPTAGVDVELRTQLWDYVRQLNAQGTTILLTTHYLQEAQELCDHIAVIQNGELIANDSKQNMMKLIDRKKMTITLAKAVKSVPAALKKFGAVLLDKTTLEISYESAKLSVNDILHALSTATLEVADLSMDEADLEEVFKHLVNKKTA
jgi:ABC-2 type transport system ATP-binding protein